MNGYDALVSQLEARGDTPEKRAAMRTLYAAGEDAKPALVAGLDSDVPSAALLSSSTSCW